MVSGMTISKKKNAVRCDKPRWKLDLMYTSFGFVDDVRSTIPIDLICYVASLRVTQMWDISPLTQSDVGGLFTQGPIQIYLKSALKPHGRKTMFWWGVKKKCSQRPRRYKKVCDLVAPAMNLKDFSILRSLTDTGCSHHFKQQTQKKRKKKVVIILQNWNNLFEQMHPRWITHTYIEIWWTQPTAE